VSDDVLQRFDFQIQSIEAYIRAYHYSNFDQAYKTFDREDLVLMDPDFRDSGGDMIRNQMNAHYESFSYLAKLKTRQLFVLFQELREPFETDNRVNIVDYNWHVDGILKNSQSYNKENPADKGAKDGANGASNHPVVKEIRQEDQFPALKTQYSRS
jgi:hypothetical protein